MSDQDIKILENVLEMIRECLKRGERVLEKAVGRERNWE